MSLSLTRGESELERRQLMAASAFQAEIAPLAQPAPASSNSGSGLSGAATANDWLTGANEARDAFDVNGDGLSAAVIDTGVNYRHSAFGGQMGSDQVVVGGWDFADNDGDPDATGWQHGTAVAGLIASQDSSRLGVAPGADIVALRVFNDQNQSSFQRIADTLQWVIDNHQTYNISVVNLSISDTRNYIADYFTHDLGVGQRISRLVDELRDLSIPVVTAAGNSFDGHQGMGFTAILPNTISVTALDTNDKLLPNAQRLGEELGKASATDLAAPGQGLSAPLETGSTQNVEGTSFSAPVVSGAILLLQDLYKSRFGALPSVDDVERWLKDGASAVHDDVTGINIKALDIARSLSLVPNPSPSPSPAPAPTPPVSEQHVTPAPAPTPEPEKPASTPAPEPAPTPAPAPAPLLDPFVEAANRSIASRTATTDRIRTYTIRGSSPFLFKTGLNSNLITKIFRSTPLRASGSYVVQKWLNS